jgi:hypothetical protein
MEFRDIVALLQFLINLCESKIGNRIKVLIRKLIQLLKHPKNKK